MFYKQVVPTAQITPATGNLKAFGIKGFEWDKSDDLYDYYPGYTNYRIPKAEQE